MSKSLRSVWTGECGGGKAESILLNDKSRKAVGGSSTNGGERKEGR